MKTTTNKITIELENADDIAAFNNIILFALDLDVKEQCMYESERKMAKRLASISDPKNYSD